MSVTGVEEKYGRLPEHLRKLRPRHLSHILKVAEVSHCAAVVKAAEAYEKLDDAARGAQLREALKTLRGMTKKAVLDGMDVYAYVVSDGEKKKVKLLRFDNGNVVVRPVGDTTEKRIEFSTLDAKTLAGCGMSCVEPDDVKGILAVIKADKGSRL